MKCPLCKQNTNVVYTNMKMPYGVSMKDENIDLEVSYCNSCSYTFQSSAYNETYDKKIAQLYSSYTISSMYNFPNRNQQHLKALEFLDGTIENKIVYNILEIGSNRGDFLYLLKEKYPNVNILGCEPTEFKDLSIPTVNAFFDKNLFNTKFDLIVLRHTLEHIKNPKFFISQLQLLLKTSGKIFIEVPNIIYSLNNFIEDFTPDHVSYFSKNTLMQICSELKLNKVDDTEYLYALFEQTSKKDINHFEKDEIEKLFKNYSKQILKIKKEIVNYDRIVFYGVSNFYLWTFTKLKEIIKTKELYYMDDNIQMDNIFGLPKVIELKGGDLVILCTSNKAIQKKMLESLPSFVKVLCLWEGIK